MGEVAQEAHFRKDTEKFVEKLNALFLEFETGKRSPDSIEEAFRCFHSIKSEAAYLEYHNIGELAHKGEELLQSCRSGSAVITTGILDQMFDITSSIEQLLHTQTAPAAAATANTSSSENTHPHIQSRISYFTQAERNLLAEAKDRNERLYRVVCSFLPDLPMKFPRAFLILNNLEQSAMVIRTAPDLHEKDLDFDSLTIFFTSSQSEAAIREIFNVDGIGSVFFSSIPWSLIFRTRKGVDKRPSSYQHRDVRVSVEKLDKVLGTLHCVKMRLFDKSPKGIEDISEIEAEIKEMRLIHLEEEFSRYTVFVRNISKELGKKVQFSYTGGDLHIDKNIVEKLSDSLMQLVRNAMVHGIEMPEKRVEAGKEAQGSVHISAESRGNGLTVTITDDGAGIDESSIREIAGHSGIFVSSPDYMDILDILSAQGFSTAPEVSHIAGRGVGLDVVREKIQNIPGGSLSMASEPGKGVTFSIHVPYAVSLVKMHIFRYESQLFALREDTIQNPVKLDWNKFSTDSSQGLLYDSNPVYTVFGRVYLMESFPREGLLIPFSLKGEAAFLYTLEDIAVEDLPREYMHTIETTIPGLYDIFLSEHKVPYLLFDP